MNTVFLLFEFGNAGKQLHSAWATPELALHAGEVAAGAYAHRQEKAKRARTYLDDQKRMRAEWRWNGVGALFMVMEEHTVRTARA